MNYRRPAVTPEQRMFDKCEKLYPQLRHGRCCLLCASQWRVRPADHIRLIIDTENPIVRFNCLNMIPLCAEHLTASLDELPISLWQKTFLEKQNKKNFNGVCIARGITKELALKELYKKIKEILL